MGLKTVYTCDECPEFELQCYSNDQNQIYICIEESDPDSMGRYMNVFLDEETAVKLSKELRRHISIIKNGGYNG